MNILTDLRAALEAKREAEAALDMLSKPGTSGFDEASWKRAYYRLKHLEDDLRRLLTDDTIRALLDVAEEGVCPICRMRMTEGVYRNEGDEYVTCRAAYHAALAPLVKEDCPTCHGLGGGGGFDRNGSHTEGRYCEYPCPTCGKEATDE